MGRMPRVLSSEIHYHVIVRCNYQAFHFSEDSDFLRYLSVLRLFKQKHEFQLFNYELMNTHVHLFLQPSIKFSLSKSMMLINWKFARDMNRNHSRKGHFWMERYKCIPVESNEYSLTLMRYINRNPVRAGMVGKCGDWKWSGYHYYANGVTDDLITPHPSYLGLSLHPEKRRKEYASLVNTQMDGDEKRDPKMSQGLYWGSDRFGNGLKGK